MQESNEKLKESESLLQHYKGFAAREEKEKLHLQKEKIAMLERQNQIEREFSERIAEIK